MSAGMSPRQPPVLWDEPNGLWHTAHMQNMPWRASLNTSAAPNRHVSNQQVSSRALPRQLGSRPPCSTCLSSSRPFFFLIQTRDTSKLSHTYQHRPTNLTWPVSLFALSQKMTQKHTCNHIYSSSTTPKTLLLRLALYSWLWIYSMCVNRPTRIRYRMRTQTSQCFKTGCESCVV